jgi:predicted nucleic acid-binding protein
VVAGVTAVVVDLSLAMSSVVTETNSQYAQAKLRIWQRSGISVLAPALFASEAASACRRLITSGRLPSLSAAELALRTVFRNVQIVPDDQLLAARALQIATIIGAGRAYDSMYIALAERERCALWTGDLRLANAARPQFPFVRGVTEPL